MSENHAFGGICDKVAGNEGVFHTCVTHGDTVTNSDSGEHDGSSACHSNTELNCFGDLEVSAKTDKNPRVLLEQLRQKRLADPKVDFPRIYLTCGTEDILYEANERYRQILESYDLDLTWEALPGAHNWAYWDTTIRKVLDWLPLENE